MGACVGGWVGVFVCGWVGGAGNPPRRPKQAPPTLHLCAGEEVVTRESFVSIGWRLLPYWLNK